MIKVKNLQEAWKVIQRIYPTSIFDDGEMEKDTYFCTDSLSPVAYVRDYGVLLEVNLDNGSSYNIWIEDAEESHEKYITVVIGVISESKVFSNVTINEVKETKYSGVIGFTYEALDDGKPGIIVHLANDEMASFHANSIAYIKTE